MRGRWRCVYLLRFRTLLVLILALNTVVFIVFNSFMLHDKDELAGKSPGFDVKAIERKDEFNFANHLSDNIKDIHGWNVLKELSEQDGLQPLLDTPLEKNTSANDRDFSDYSEVKISVEGDKSIVSNNVTQKASQDEQNRLLPLKISTPSSHRQNRYTERLIETTKKSLKESLLTKSSVHPSNSPNGNAVTKRVSNLRTSSHDMLKVEPSKRSLDAKRNSFPHSIQNHSLLSVKNNEEQVDKILPTTAKSLTQEDLNNIAQNLQVRFEVLEDIRRAEVSLRNKGISPIEGNQWSIHFCVTTGIELDHLVHRPEGYVLPSQKAIKLTHFNGCTYRLEPTRDFKAILPGNALKFVVHIGATLAKSDLVPRWYVAADGLEPRTISNTADESLDFVVLSKRKRAWDRFQNNDATDLKMAPLLVVPTPLEIVGLNESMKLSIDSQWVVLGEPGLEEETSFLAGKLQVQKSLAHSTNRKVIQLALGKVTLEKPDDKDQLSNQSSSESYQLEVNVSEQFIKVTGTGNAGVFYGVQTLLALMDDQGLVPQVSIKDCPRFSYRGLMLDVVRNFQPKREVMKLLDVMAMYKMNKFHFHLSDNEGWRLEIPGIEELTSVGSRRCHDLQEKTCIMSQLGSGPDTSTSGTGHYSTEDYREILRHATQRHIQVIPEFDFPGHSHAAIKSMIARHDRLMQQGNEGDAKIFLLNDFKDESRYLSVQIFTDETSNCCLNSTYTLMEYILTTLVNLHHDIQPLTVYHFGGDEVPGGAWKRSPACEQLAQTLNFPYNNVNTHNKLKEYFLRRLSNITARMNVGVGGWGDFLFEPKTRSIASREFFPNKEVYSFAWSRTRAVKKNHEVSLMANHGYKVVLSSPDYIYLDHPYEPVGEERGKYWATTYTDTRKIFNFAPEELYEDIDEIRNCSGFKKCVDGRQNILGVEAAVWSETIRTADHMYSMIFPRLLALAERAWHKAPWEGIKDRLAQDREKTGNWVNFANTLGYKELGRLDKMGVTYHVTPPGARFVGKTLETRAVLPGLKVEYSTDEGVTWSDVTTNTEVEGKIKLRTRSANGQLVSREVEIESPTLPPVENKNDPNIVSAPGAESKREPEKKEKQEGAEHTKEEAKSQGKKEKSAIKEEMSENLEEKTERKDGNSDIKDKNSEQKDTPSKEKLENDGETKASVKKDIAENLHDKDDQANPLQQDGNKARVISQIEKADSESEITNERSEHNVLKSKER